eukprot:15401596-Alexandrium_andersonii.AAC.1
MSASLVGSEMCIRDRVQAREAPREARRLVKLAARQVASPTFADPKPQRGCLLYTSDAADDM